MIFLATNGTDIHETFVPPSEFVKMASLLRILLAIFVAGVCVGLSFLYKFLYQDPVPPEVKQDGWWGRRDKTEQDMDDSVREFQINVSDDLLLDLRQRLDNFRYGEDLENADFNYGFRNDYMREVVEYWRDQYNWTEQERLLNRYRHYRTKIEGIDVHFVRATPAVIRPRKPWFKESSPAQRSVLKSLPAAESRPVWTPEGQGLDSYYDIPRH